MQKQWYPTSILVIGYYSKYSHSFESGIYTPSKKKKKIKKFYTRADVRVNNNQERNAPGRESKGPIQWEVQFVPYKPKKNPLNINLWDLYKKWS